MFDHLERLSALTIRLEELILSALDDLNAAAARAEAALSALEAAVANPAGITDADIQPITDGLNAAAATAEAAVAPPAPAEPAA